MISIPNRANQQPKEQQKGQARLQKTRVREQLTLIFKTAYIYPFVCWRGIKGV